MAIKTKFLTLAAVLNLNVPEPGIYLEHTCNFRFPRPWFNFVNFPPKIFKDENA